MEEEEVKELPGRKGNREGMLVTFWTVDDCRRKRGLF